jgi:RIO kinase 2
VENLAYLFLGLSKEDLSVLRAVEAGMRDHEWVPLPEIARSCGLSERRSEFRLASLSQKKLVFIENLHYQGYQIGFGAYDLLALADLVEKGIVTGLGNQVGVGKESVVYEGLGDGPLIIKLHRQGQTSFKHVRRARGHLRDLPRSSWLHAASLAARHEFRVMGRLYGAVSIPQPVAYSRHALAMEQVSGSLLQKVELADSGECLEQILMNVQTAFRLGIIHADLSEFNVMVTAEGIKIIDWPQAVDASHPNAVELLKRDLHNILGFFARRFGIERELEEVLAMVMSAEVT